MHEAIKGLEPQALWSYFSDLSAIPRESGNEEGVRQYLLAFAKEHNLEAIVEEIGNVIIKKPAAKGFEQRPSVALQGHMDMVCVKTPESTHNFESDPIELVRDGDWLRAKDTSLGADNGIAVAIILDILSDSNAQHGPLEAIFTVAEETGLNGAFGLEKEHIDSRLLINLDSEEEGIFYIGCAGGVETDVELTAKWESTPAHHQGFELVIDGLKGGHSGAEIHTQRANSIKIAARLLTQLAEYRIFKAEGGSKRNVIPSTATIGFTIPKDQEAHLHELVKTTLTELLGEFEVADPAISLTVTKGETPSESIDASRLFDALYSAPHGVDAMSLSLEGIVETSTNLAILSLDKEKFTVTASHRSSILSARDDVARRFATIFDLAGAKTSHSGGYPSWKPNVDSPLAAFAARAWKEYANEEPVITAIHAGLECGIINSKVPGMDSVSFGPDMSDVHSTKEKVSIPSTKRISDFTRHLLEIIE
ncbi:MAG: aminoacyl-histidine dipeptidase [Sphaerochaeta sp.]